MKLIYLLLGLQAVSIIMACAVNIYQTNQIQCLEQGRVYVGNGFCADVGI